MSCWGKWSLLHCNKGTDLRSMALCKGIPTKVIQHMATLTEEPTTKPRISSGCKAFTLPKPVASQTAQKTQTVHKATLTLPELCLECAKNDEGYWPYCQTGRFIMSEKDTLGAIQSTDTQRVFIQNVNFYHT